MSRSTQWVIAATSGAVAALGYLALGPAVGLVLILAVSPLGVRDEDRLRTSGLLVGAGASWFLLAGRSAVATGALTHVDTPIGLLVVGALLLVAGLVLASRPIGLIRQAS